jgi:hypothetical protein
MDQPPAGESEGLPSQQPPTHQIYFVTVEWQDAPHQPESPERLAQQIRQLIEHDHDHGPQMPPSRFTVRVKTDNGSAEVKGLVMHRHLHQHPPQPPFTEV